MKVGPARAIGVLLVLLGAVLLISMAAERVPAARWGVRLGEAGMLGALALLLVGIAGTAIGLPRQLVALIAGYAFGPLLGVPLALTAAVGGCALTVLAARRWLRSPVRRRYPKAVDGLANFVRGDTFWKVVVLRLQPFGTNLISNLAAGVIRLPIGTFLSASLVGYIPQTLVFVLTGSGVRVGSTVELGVAAGLMALSLLIAAVLWRRHGTGADVR